VNVMSAVAKYDETIEPRSEGKSKLNKSGSLLLECIQYHLSHEPSSLVSVPTEMILDGGGFGFRADAVDAGMVREYFFKRNGGATQSSNRGAYKRGVDALNEAGLAKLFDGVFAVSTDVNND